MDRSSGVLMHISSLPSPYSCGDFGKGAYEFVDLLKESGFKYWQVLPFCIPDNYNSPYMSYSSFGGNPFFISLDCLYEKGLITKNELAAAEQKSPYLCEFSRLNDERLLLLKKASERFKDNDKLNAFFSNRPRIEKCCEFMALKEKNQNKPWNEWQEKECDEDTLFAWKFIQYEFFTQWNALHKYANDNGIKIIGDLPIYVSYDSQDVFFDRDSFLLDANSKPAWVSGVPPDYFSKDGQLWGNPIYDFEKMKKDGYKLWRDRIAHTLSVFDAVRIDHFRAISEYFKIPADAKSAREGHFEKGPGMELVNVINKEADGKLIIAENLGIIDDKVRSLLKQSKYPGMAVFQFGFDGNPNNPHLPHNYRENLVAYTGTHDNNTLLGFLWEQSDSTRQAVLEYIGFGGDDWNKSYECIMKTMLRSSADLVIFPIQDILGYGADTRLNTPGMADGNWQFRVTASALAALDRSRLCRLNSLYAR